MRKKKNNLILILLLLLVGIGVGYAALTTTLNINGNTTVKKASWDIHFENLQITDGSVTATTDAAIDSDTTTINYEINLEKPGDFYEFTVDIVNNGTIDAMISEVLKEGLTTEQEAYIFYTVDYYNNSCYHMQEKDLLKSGTGENIKVRIEYRSDIDASELPTDVVSLSLKCGVSYVQDDGTSRVINTSGLMHCGGSS